MLAHESFPKGLVSRWQGALAVNYKRRLARYIRAEVALFSRVKGIEPAAKDELIPLVRAHAKRVAEVDYWSRNILEMESAHFTGLGKFAPTSNQRSPSTAPVGTYMMLLSLLVGLLFQSFWLAAMTFVLVGIVLFTLSEYGRSSRYPETNLVEDLLVALVIIEEHGALWGSSNIRVDVMNRLERAAITLERRLPRKLPTDPATRDWIRHEFKSRAAAIRMLKRLVVSPDPASLDQLSKRVADSLAAAIKGTWMLLEAAEPEELRKQARLRWLDPAWIGPTAVILLLALLMGLSGALDPETILVATLPWILIWLAEKTFGLKVPDTLKVILTILWAMVFIVPSVEPDWKTRIEDLTRLRDFVP